MPKYLDNDGLLYFWQKIKNTFAAVSHSHSISDVTDLQTTLDGKAASSHTHTIANVTDLQTTLDGKAPKSHASTATTYGAGTSSNYGHVKLSDATNGTAAAASGGMAATPKAVSDALAAAKDYADNLDTGVTSVAGKTGAVTLDKSDVGLGNVDNTADANKSVASAAKLTTGANIAGRKFDGTSNIVFSGTSSTAASTAIKEVTLDTGGSINSIQDGTFLFVKFSNTPTNTSNMYLKIGESSWPVIDGKGNNITNNSKYIQNYRYSVFIRNTIASAKVWQVLPIVSENTTYSTLTQAIATAGTDTTGKLITAKILHDSIVELLPDEYTHPTYTEHSTSQLYKFTNDATGHVNAATAATASDIKTLLGTTAVNRATADASGNNIADTYAKKTDIAGTYKYKGSVASESALPTTGQTTGDVYNIETASSYGAAGANVAWNGTAWDSLGEIFSIESITNSEIDTIVAS